ncbi:hypothetical protein MIND_00107200 [Mycena indigotica]|uniref:DUF7918 domain-containing protein n=1 Tax=Mycena indigotica TaxID=2126181 RepID=A0A8H6TEI2_9AGAR|nr:uncharacterized protein MIND_00107200 [Mycena indigotica]KAF7315906.1 hypothetical protein MIND_00107200 [Mycena indigotica]
MLELNGFSAQIMIGDVEMKEYGVEIDEKAKLVTCWIASEVGQQFSVKWRRTGHRRRGSHNKDISGRVFVDGMKCKGQILRKDDWDPIQRKGIKTDNGTKLLPFRFSSLALTDDDHYLDQSLPETIGSIELKIYPVSLGSRTGSWSTQREGGRAPLVVHERTKKGLSQHVGFGDAVASRQRHTISTKYLGPPIVIFRFKYRSLDVLRASGIAPQAACDTTLEVASNSSSSTRAKPNQSIPSTAVATDKQLEDELEELNERMLAVKSQMALRKVGKREDGKVPVKSEGKASPRIANPQPMVIDLTSD